jgi:hypothetical protein
MLQAQPSFAVNLLDVFLARLPNISSDPYGRNVNCSSRTRPDLAVNTLRLGNNSHAVNVGHGKFAAYPELQNTSMHSAGKTIFFKPLRFKGLNLLLLLLWPQSSSICSHLIIIGFNHLPFQGRMEMCVYAGRGTNSVIARTKSQHGEARFASETWANLTRVSLTVTKSSHATESHTKSKKLRSSLC